MSKACEWLTSKGKDEDANGDDPWHSAVALPKLLHQVLEEDTQALEGPVGADLHKEEGPCHSPAPTAIRHFLVNLRTQTTPGVGSRHGNSKPPDETDRDDISDEEVLVRTAFVN